MKAKHQRLIKVFASLAIMAAAAAAILYSFRDNMVFFYTPSQYASKKQEAKFNAARPVRLGGLVKKGSVENQPNGGLCFAITDMTADMRACYRGLVPSLFREGQGVVAQGMVGDDGVLEASSILAKHDENYMPREVVEELKASGQWQEGERYTPPSTRKP